MKSPVLGVQSLPNVGPWPTLDPFLFCVHHNDQYPVGTDKLGPKASLSGRRIGQDFENIDGWNMYHGEHVPGFPKHPHRGFETITFVKTGMIDHADSLGAAARYGDGDVQWLTAGDGINHAEMFPLLNAQKTNPIDFFQIWLNLPARSKRAAPHFSMFWAPDVPVVRIQDVKKRETVITVVSGSTFSIDPPLPPPASWARDQGNHVGVARIEMQPGATYTLPAGKSGTNRALYVAQGDLNVAEHKRLSRVQLVLQASQETSLSAGKDGAMLLLLEGQPIAEPVAKYGPFVMNTQEEIAQAFADYRRTGFGGWSWPSPEPVHGVEKRKFARHADGRMDKPA